MPAPIPPLQRRGERTTDSAFLKYTLSAQLAADKLAAYESHYRAIQRVMQEKGTWREGLRFADIGCGLGLYSEYWQKKGFRVTGIDLNQETLAVGHQRARTNSLRIHYAAGSATAIPLASGSFDIVFAMSLLEHVPDWEACAGELTRLLAPGGLLWIETTNVWCPRQREFRWLPCYSWWPAPAKRIAEDLARGPWPALANYTPWPAVHWFSFFGLRRFMTGRGLQVTDRFDEMDTAGAGLARRIVKWLARTGDAGRAAAYLLVSSIIVFVTRPLDAPNDA